ncbi:MAG: MBL fold metallo-hydrolase [Opitutaceae bacterium]|nr:MBL fold metallo-hydrolase [Opitutaceae bacterium]
MSDHCDGWEFFNPRGHVNRTWIEVLKWRLTSRAKPWPLTVALPRQPRPKPSAEGEVVATWINHATFLLQTSAGNVLTDPIYGARASPFAWAGPRRAHLPGLPFEQLPHIDVILLSHDHYDHCHLSTLRRLAQAFQPVVITPLGNGPLIARAGLQRIIELDWWQHHAINPDFQVTLTPARHWSNRLSGARNGRLWGGFYLHSAKHRIYFSGDTGYDSEFFKAIGRNLGPPDLAMIPIGAYEPRWFMAAQHCNPVEAVQIHRDVGARQSLGMHWGTFQLTDEAREDPVQALSAACKAANLTKEEFRALLPGESVRV